MEELPNATIKKWRSEKGFRTIYRHYAPYVWRVSFRMTNGNKLLAEEITQSVFVKLLRALPGFKFQSAFSSWLYTITYHEALAILKKRKQEYGRSDNLNEETQGDGSREVTSWEHKRAISGVLSTLSEDERFLLVSREVDGFSFEELAAITGKKSGALRTALSRLKREIQQKFSEGSSL